VLINLRNPIQFLKRSQTSGLANPAQWFMDMFARRTNSGQNVNELTALQLAAVSACVRIISTTIAKVPKYLLEEKENGDLIKAKNQKLYYYQISEQPSDLYNKFNFDRQMLTYRLLWGNAYAYPHRNKYGEVYKRTILYPWAVQPTFIDGELYYYNSDTRYMDIPRVLRPYEIYHLKGISTDGYVGKSPIRLHAESLGVTLAAESYGGAFFGNSAIPSGLITVPGNLSPAQNKQMRDSWMDEYGNDNKGSVAVLGSGATFQAMSIPPEEAQFLETRKYGVREIAAIYGVPLHMLGDLERATFSNIEHQSIEFVKGTLTDYTAEIEWEDESKILTEAMRGDFEVRYDFSDLLKGDSVAQMTYCKDGIQNGIFSINDARKFLGHNNVEGGDQRFIGVNNAPIEDIKLIYQNKATQPPAQRTLGFLTELEQMIAEKQTQNSNGK